MDEEGTFAGRALDSLREIVVELEVWRQNARTVEERQALQRVTTLLHHAASELRLNGRAVPDPAQQTLPLILPIRGVGARVG
jgi:hypothetical protein